MASKNNSKLSHHKLNPQTKPTPKRLIPISFPAQVLEWEFFEQKFKIMGRMHHKLTAEALTAKREKREMNLKKPVDEALQELAALHPGASQLQLRGMLNDLLTLYTTSVAPAMVAHGVYLDPQSEALEKRK